MSDFWESAGDIVFDATDTEAVVETRLVIPFLQALGYDKDSDIVPKKSVYFQQGRKKIGRPNEADFVVYNGPTKDNNTSLIAVEVKRPSEKLSSGKDQAESYSIALRTPIFILTNGFDLEIWQLQAISESACILECSVSELPEKRGAVESLIAKQAAITHSKGLLIKDFGLSAGDTIAYIEAEIKRKTVAQPFVQRTLSLGHNLTPIPSSKILLEFLQGALITGPSGFGKTELSEHLFRCALSSYSTMASRLLPIEVRLTDLVAEQKSILEYAHQRVNAHCPQITYAKFSDILKEHGAVIFCDGLERVQTAAKDRIAAEMSAIRRDFPNTAVFVFSRLSSANEIFLPVLALQELDYGQRREFEKSIIPNLSYDILWDLTDALKSRLGHPIFLKLLCEHHKKFGTSPQTLTSLFDDWLNRCLEWRDPSPAIRIQRENALSLLAERTLSAPISTISAFEFLRDANFAHDIFDALVESDALNISQKTVELAHEALADFLRAKHLAGLPLPDFVAALEHTNFRSDSLLATLLMGQLHRPESQRALWKRLCQLGIRDYLGAFKFRADASPSLLALTDAEARFVVLQEILEGFEDTGKAFFPQLWDEICREEAGQATCSVAIGGSVTPGLSDVFYSLLPRAAQDPHVLIGPEYDGFRRRYLSLVRSNYRPDSGRTIGVSILLKALEAVVDGRKLKGGAALARERLASRVRFLVERKGFPEDCVDLNVIISNLKDYQDDIVRIDQIGSNNKDFHIRHIIEDATTCLASGDDAIDKWWVKYLGNDGHVDEKFIDIALAELYSRAEMIISETFEFSFRSLRSEIQGYIIRPIQWRLTANIFGEGAWPLEAYWFPVNIGSSPLAVVNIVSETFEEASNRSLDKIYNAVVEELRRLGRRSDVIISQSHGQLPDFSGYSWTGGYSSETPAISLAHDWIMADLKILFSDFPDQI